MRTPTVSTAPVIWGWRALHLLVAFAVPLVLVLILSGCKRAKEEPEDLGPVATADQVDAALGRAIDMAELPDPRPDQFVYYDVSRRIENEESTINLGSLRVTVMPKNDPAHEVLFPLRIVDVVRLANGQFEERISEDKIAPREPMNFAKIGSLHAMNISALSRRTSFHRLQESSAVIPAPRMVRERSDCGGISPCELQVRLVQFDLVIWTSDTKFIKIHIDMAFSPQPPWIPFGEDFQRVNGLLIKDCRSTYVDIGSRRVYVRDCQDLQDFHK